MTRRASNWLVLGSLRRDVVANVRGEARDLHADGVAACDSRERGRRVHPEANLAERGRVGSFDIPHVATARVAAPHGRPRGKRGRAVNASATAAPLTANVP